ncbi:MAG: hypothetical protein IPL97_02120 [Niastella sp.]|nr:hypothetical protein [Niastella sp.]
MKKIIGFICIFLSLHTAKAQSLAQVSITQNAKSAMLSFETADHALINIDKTGTLISWGMENTQRMLSRFPQKLDPYMGRVDYYSDIDDAALRGKVKYIGATAITYYASYEKENLVGKVKSIGSINFTYYEPYEDKSYAGNIQQAGNVSVSFYGSFDNDAMKGNFKSIGNIQLTYYSSFDDKSFAGKIKSIDGNVFTYYSSFERKEFNGIMKSGFITKTIQGIKYIVFPN